MKAWPAGSPTSSGSVPDILVIEIASNDGYLLQHYLRPRRAGARHRPGGATSPRSPSSAASPPLVRLLRREHRAASCVPRARPRRRAARQQRHGPRARHQRLRRAASPRSCADDGVVVIETPYVRDLDRAPSSSTPSTTSTSSTTRSPRVDALVRAARAWSSSTSSASRSTAGRCGSFVGTPAHAAAADRGAATARRGGGARASTRRRYYRDFADRVDELARRLRAASTTLHGDGDRIAAYGAAAKGTVLLNALRLGRDADRLRRRSQPAQAGPAHARRRASRSRPEAAARRPARRTSCCSPGTSPTRSSTSRPSTGGRGGRFIVPIPELRGRGAMIDGVSVRAAAPHPRRAGHRPPHARSARIRTSSSSARSTSPRSTAASSRAGTGTAR